MSKPIYKAFNNLEEVVYALCQGEKTYVVNSHLSWVYDEVDINTLSANELIYMLRRCNWYKKVEEIYE